MIQQNFREMNKCKNCNKETNNKVYCSTNCQHEGYRLKKINRVKTNCLYCGNEIETLPNKIKTGKSKYCSRKCKDVHQKQLYKKNGNPVYGRESTKEEKEIRSKIITELWKDENFRKKVTDGQKKFFEKNGYWCGTDEESKNKKNETNLKKYGVECIFSLEYYQNLREEICLDKYGKTSLELAREGLKNTYKTSIEIKICNLLIEYGFKFETQYDLFYGIDKFKTYDFYLKEYNLLIEADGDYWHVNPNKYLNENDLTEVQKINKQNDIFKNKLATDKGYNILRFWESDIKKKNFKYKLLNEIKKYAKK